MKQALRIIKYFLKGVAGVLIICLIVYAVLSVVWGLQLKHKLSEIRERGDAVSPSDIVRSAAPINRNAALAYEQAFKLLKGQSQFDGELREFCYVQDPSARAELEPGVRQLVLKNQSAIPLTVKAESLPAYSFPTNTTAYGQDASQHLWRITMLSRLVSAKAILLAEDGDTRGSLDMIITALKATRAVENEPCLATFFGWSSGVRRTLSSLQVCLDGRDISYSQTQNIYAELAKIPTESFLPLSMQGERVRQNQMFDQARIDVTSLVPEGRKLIQHITWMPMLNGVGAHFVTWLWKPISYKDQLVYLELLDQYQPIISKPFREITSSNPAGNEMNIPSYAIITKKKWGVPERIWCSRDATIAEVGLAQTVMTLKAYKSKFGCYPTSLKQAEDRIGWKIPKDPFSSGEFIYRRTAKGFLLYSVGKNLKDDGGKSTSSDSDTEDGDITWRSAF